MEIKIILSTFRTASFEYATDHDMTRGPATAAKCGTMRQFQSRLLSPSHGQAMLLN
jgi:hypothetical protein